jgi:putative transposase
VQEASAIRREIAATAAAAKTPKSRLKEMTRARHAAEAKKPYADFAAPSVPTQEKLDPDRPRRVFPVEDW